MDSFLPSDAISIIDISLLSSSSLSSKGEDELQKIKSALTSWRCFEASNSCRMLALIPCCMGEDPRGCVTSGAYESCVPYHA
ncbi:hypothetical protein CK203_074056 [Vitis vinifera]|uniref:Uncharacterized protein n=1 Tax=Vitis vinifera TaxID=29760 RepID=A0A438E7Y5_VITVI|nr:hypothetical protein CK203_074056 [Vitis vinifera]